MTQSINNASLTGIKSIYITKLRVSSRGVLQMLVKKKEKSVSTGQRQMLMRQFVEVEMLSSLGPGHFASEIAQEWTQRGFCTELHSQAAHFKAKSLQLALQLSSSVQGE